MNETIKTILSRRSIRSFKPEQLKKEELDTIIECGLNAPSTVNSQSWHFTVIQNRDLLDRMNIKIKEVLPDDARERYLKRHNGDENFDMFYNAPTVIFVSNRKNSNGSIVNCSLATENMLIAAESLSIGSCIIGLAKLLFKTDNAEAYLKELAIPEDYEPLHAISFGYKNDVSDKPDRVPGKVNFIY